MSVLLSAASPAACIGIRVTTEVSNEVLMPCTVAVTAPLASVTICCTYFVPLPLLTSQPQPFAAGALVSTVEDVAKWDAALYGEQLLKKSTLKVYEKFPHGMCTTHADVVNPELLAFIKS